MEKMIAGVLSDADRYASRFMRVALGGLVLALMVMPQLALAQAGGVGTLCANANSALQWIEIGVYFILVVAVLGAAVAASFGRMEWMTVGKILIGCIICGIAVPVVTALSGLNGC